MTHIQEASARQREIEHAKLLRYRERQALVFLQRGDDDALTVIVQLWCAASDEQLRISLSSSDHPDNDGIAQRSFTKLDDENLTDLLDTLGVPQVLAGFG